MGWLVTVALNHLCPAGLSKTQSYSLKIAVTLDQFFLLSKKKKSEIATVTLEAPQLCMQQVCWTHVGGEKAGTHLGCW